MDSEDIEGLVRRLTRDYEGVDLVLALCYNDGESKQKTYMIRVAGSHEQCQKLTKMAWESIKPKPVSEPDEAEEDTE